ncbi:predicted protein [Naegleria gruberi]|uniref:Predicted protein n=1 Tax=Naegleria gruberi TaxID=5762 RepID=D2V1M7_NAEGR|nr:uncharacterized protein NAEGRDRAFT_62631 [Naegleria gruberi]EFC49186.1 predicted protein [Naegleria gruberi]|eukprot:XP_002681930.1 predicted protein [Naegleria gruberi strain NEG-M]
MNSRNIYSNNAGSVVGSDSSQESHNTSSTNSSSFQHKIRVEVFNFFFASQNVSKKQGGKRFFAILLLYILIYWSYIWLPVLSPQDFHFGAWGSWIFSVFNYTTSLSMDLLPYEGAIAVASITMTFIAITVCITIITLWAVKSTSQYIKKIQMILHINAYLIIVLSAPIIFILTSFVDCDYGYNPRESLINFVSHHANGTSISSTATLTPMLNRFTSMECYSTNNIILMAVTLSFIALYFVLCVLANFLVPNSHPLSFAPMITEGYIFPIGMSLGNCIGILVHFLIPAEYAFVRSIVHLVYGMCMLVVIMKSLPMYRRYENTIVCGVVCARFGTSIGSIISFFVNASNTAEIGIGMWALTTGLAVGLGLVGAVSMDIYTRYVIYFIKTRYILSVRSSDRSLEKEATNIYFKLEEDGTMYKMMLYMRFVLMRYARTKTEELEDKYDLVALISFIRGISSQKCFSDIELLSMAGTLVGYLMVDEMHSSYFAQALLKRALKQRPDVYKRFLIHQRLREVELTGADDVKGSRTVLELKSIMLNIQKYITELTSLHRHFWKELMQEIVNYEKAENIVARCSVINHELDSMFDNILSLYYNDKTVLRTYASYLENFKFNKELANEYYTEASSLEEEESRIPLAQKGNRRTKNKVFPDVQESVDISKKLGPKGLAVGRSVAFENLETASYLSSNMDFNGVENANADTKREIGFRNALSLPDSHTIHIITFVFFIVFAFILLVVGLVIGLQFSKGVTMNVVNVIEACSPICALSNVLQSVRAFQMHSMFNSTLGSSNIPLTLTSESYIDLANTKILVSKFKDILVNLQQKAYNAKFDGTVYSNYHEVYSEIYMPNIGDDSKFYNHTTKINVTVTDVTNTLIKISDQIINSKENDITKTLNSYGFMFLYINHESITDIYDKFCNIFTDSAKTEALAINNIFTIYISVSLATFILCGALYMIFSRKELTVVREQIKLIQHNVSKNEIGKLFHDLGKKVGDEVSIHISRNSLFKPKNAFLIVSAFLIIIVSVSCGIYLDQTLGNSTYSFESYITMEDGFDTMTHLQYVSFIGTEYFSHVTTSIVGSETLQLLDDDEVEAMEDKLSYLTKQLRYFWNLCMYGSSVKAYETLVVGMFPETDQMIRGSVNCTVEKLSETYIAGGNNSTTCEMGIDYMVQDTILMIYKMVQDLEGVHHSKGKTSISTLIDLLNDYFKINYMTKTISLKLIEFSNIFAVKSSTPLLNNMIGLAVVGFASNIICAILMFLLLNNHRRSAFAMRGLFNYLSIDTLENNEKLRNYALYHTLGDNVLSKLKTKKQTQNGEDAKVRSILNAAVDGVVLCSSSASIDIFNPAAQRMFGNQQEDVIGKYIFTLFAPQHHGEIRKSIEGMKHTVSANDSKGETFEIECIRKNNTTFPATVNIFVTIFDKKPIITCFIKDITSEKKHNSLLAEEKKNSETLLLNILPGAVASKLKSGASLIAERFPDVTCFFSDMVGFTSLSSKLTPNDLVQMLNSIVMGFDDLMDKYHLEKIKTIGDAYFAAGGLHDLNAQSDHPERVLRFAIDTFSVIRAYNSEHRKGRVNEQINIRIGINTGPVVAGVIGRKKFAYDLWGDSINTASRMESNSKPGRIQISRSTYERVHDLGFTFEERKIEVKGKGLTQTYLLDAKHHQSAVLTEEELTVTITTNQDHYQDADIELEENEESYLELEKTHLEKPSLPVGQSMTFGSVSEMSDEPNPKTIPTIPTITTTEFE